MAVSFALAALMWPRSDGALQAIVHEPDGATRTLDLSRDQRVVVETPLGRNVVVVQDGSARIEEADCPNGDCLRQHPISQPGQQLICLPHELWVEVVAQGGEPGQMDARAVGTDDDARADLVAR